MSTETDRFADAQPGLDSPAFHAVEVTPNAAALAYVARALYIGVSGNLTVTMKGSGNEVHFTNVPVGIFPISVTHVKAVSAGSPTTTTTASGIVALW